MAEPDTVTVGMGYDAARTRRGWFVAGDPAAPKCGDCQGTGKLDTEDCPQCAGRGSLEWITVAAACVLVGDAYQGVFDWTREEIRGLRFAEMSRGVSQRNKQLLRRNRLALRKELAEAYEFAGVRGG